MYKKKQIPQNTRKKQTNPIPTNMKMKNTSSFSVYTSNSSSILQLLTIGLILVFTSISPSVVHGGTITGKVVSCPA